MGKRKSVLVSEEMDNAATRYNELKILQEQAALEEKTKIETITNKIKGLAETNQMFCGLIITRADMISMVQLMLETGENIRVDFRLYYNE